MTVNTTTNVVYPPYSRTAILRQFPPFLFRINLDYYYYFHTYERSLLCWLFFSILLLDCWIALCEHGWYGLINHSILALRAIVSCFTLVPYGSKSAPTRIIISF